jgi:hypothetical protein
MPNINWTIVNLGKFENKGLTLPQIVLTEVAGFVWTGSRP